MKNLIYLIAIFSSVTLYGQQLELKWKISPGDALVYSTVMEQVDSSYFEMDFGEVFKSIKDSTSDTENDAKKAQQILKDINKSIGSTQYAVRLFKSTREHIEVEMFTTSEKLPIKLPDSLTEAKNMMKEFQKLNKGVVLRGSINQDGTIHSFWMKRAQKNLLSIFFELPGRPINIGDTWSLTTSLIGNDYNFICDSSYQKNEVKLIDVRKTNNETVAVFKYDLNEYVNGIFNVPNMFGQGGSKPTMMNFGFQGIAEFSIEKGKWNLFDGMMFGDATGVINTKQRVKYSLIEQ